MYVYFAKFGILAVKQIYREVRFFPALSKTWQKGSSRKKYTEVIFLHRARLMGRFRRCVLDAVFLFFKFNILLFQLLLILSQTPSIPSIPPVPSVLSLPSISSSVSSSLSSVPAPPSAPSLVASLFSKAAIPTISRSTVPTLS